MENEYNNTQTHQQFQMMELTYAELQKMDIHGVIASITITRQGAWWVCDINGANYQAETMERAVVGALQSALEVTASKIIAEYRGLN